MNQVDSLIVVQQPNLITTREAIERMHNSSYHNQEVMMDIVETEETQTSVHMMKAVEQLKLRERLEKPWRQFKE